MTPFLQLTPAAAERIWNRNRGPNWLMFDAVILSGSWTFEIEPLQPTTKDTHETRPHRLQSNPGPGKQNPR